MQGNWFGQTAEKGAHAICGTVCGCVLIPVCIFLVFFGEYNFVKDQNNIYQINKEMIEVTHYDPKNDGVAVVYTAMAEASDFTAATWGFTMSNAFGYSYSGQIYRNDTSFVWSSTKGDVGTDSRGQRYNQYTWKSPCDTSSLGSARCSGTQSNSVFTVGNYTGTDFLAQDYTSSATATAMSVSTIYSKSAPMKNNKWVMCGGYISNNYDGTTNSSKCSSASGVSHGSLRPGDQAVSFSYYPAGLTVTVCSRQTTGKTFEVLKDDGSYDIMVAGKKTKQDCIDIMNAKASATVWAFRIIGFLGFWLGFVLLLSFIEFLGDTITQCIPCGIGEALDECLHCLICVATCPPACMCFLTWFAIAWILFRPLYGAIFLGIALCGFAGMFYLHKNAAEKQPAGGQDYAALNGNSGYAPPQQQRQPVYPQQPQQPAYQPQQQAYQPQQAPAYIQQDLNNNGVPDHYEQNLPPGFEARMDPNTNRVYWVNHNNGVSTWNDPRQQSQIV